MPQGPSVEDQIADLEALLATDPNNFDILCTLAPLLTQQHRYDDALSVSSDSTEEEGGAHGLTGDQH